jgi:hypothetical protein
MIRIRILLYRGPQRWNEATRKRELQHLDLGDKWVDELLHLVIPEWWRKWG